VEQDKVAGRSRLRPCFSSLLLSSRDFTRLPHSSFPSSQAVASADQNHSKPLLIHAIDRPWLSPSEPRYARSHLTASARFDVGTELRPTFVVPCRWLPRCLLVRTVAGRGVLRSRCVVTLDCMILSEANFRPLLGGLVDESPDSICGGGTVE
jgi:hypothetical protein